MWIVCKDGLETNQFPFGDVVKFRLKVFSYDMSDFNKLLLASQFLEPSIFTKDGFLIFDKLIDLDDQNLKN